MKYLLLLLLLLPMSCSINDCMEDGITLIVNENPSALDPQIRISYSSDVIGYKLYTGCGYPPTWELLDSSTTKGWADWVVVRKCTPEYVRVINAKGVKMVKI